MLRRRMPRGRVPLEPPHQGGGNHAGDLPQQHSWRVKATAGSMPHRSDLTMSLLETPAARLPREAAYIRRAPLRSLSRQFTPAWPPEENR